jgi:hypothetical protein
MCRSAKRDVRQSTGIFQRLSARAALVGCPTRLMIPQVGENSNLCKAHPEVHIVIASVVAVRAC